MLYNMSVYFITGVDPSLANHHNCTVIHYYEGKLCYQVKDQPAAGTGIWYAGKNSHWCALVCIDLETQRTTEFLAFAT